MAAEQSESTWQPKKETLKMLNRSVANLNKSKASAPIDLSVEN